MTVAALPSPDILSLVTLADRSDGAPAWQSRLGWPAIGAAHVTLDGATSAQRNMWAAKLDEAVRHADRPVLLVASGVSCLAASWWGRLSPKPYVSRVAGALFFAPSDGGTSARDAAMFDAPRIGLPFPSLLLDNRGGEVTGHTVARLAAEWGSCVVDDGEGERGGQDAGPFRQAWRMIDRFTAAIVERDVRMSRRIGML